MTHHRQEFGFSQTGSFSPLPGVLRGCECLVPGGPQVGQVSRQGIQVLLQFHKFGRGTPVADPGWVVFPSHKVFNPA